MAVACSRVNTPRAAPASMAAAMSSAAGPGSDTEQGGRDRGEREDDHAAEPDAGRGGEAGVAQPAQDLPEAAEPERPGGELGGQAAFEQQRDLVDHDGERRERAERHRGGEQQERAAAGDGVRGLLGVRPGGRR